MSWTSPPAAPDAPTPSDSAADFDTKALNVVAWFSSFISWVATFFSELDTYKSNVDSSATAASGTVEGNTWADPWGAWHTVASHAHRSVEIELKPENSTGVSGS